MKTIYLYLSALILIFTTSCDDFVEVDVPASQLTGKQIFEDKATANAALADLYSKLRDNSVLSGLTMGSSATLGLYADELNYHGFGGDDTDQLYINSVMPSNGITTDRWNVSYHQIYCANAIIEGVAAAAALEQAEKDQFTGEALFVRALVHSYLVGLYGDVPYATTTDHETNRLASRLPANEVYQLIKDDLEEAIALLPEGYIGSERVRPNKSVATALLARVLLYTGDWAAAADAASAVINNPLYVWETDLDKLFLKESTETLWQFKPMMAGNNTDEGAMFAFFWAPPPFISLRNELIEAFEAGDLRKDHWTLGYSDGTNTFYHPYKYKQYMPTGTSVEYSIVFRLTEQYLIRAEARARQGELTAAKEDLNKVRNRAGLNNTDAVGTDAIVAAVLRERRVELFTEHGHRFFDLKRTGMLDAVLDPIKSGWDSTDKHWPIPENELIANPNMVQNPGY